MGIGGSEKNYPPMLWRQFSWSIFKSDLKVSMTKVFSRTLTELIFLRSAIPIFRLKKRFDFLSFIWWHDMRKKRKKSKILFLCFWNGLKSSCQKIVWLNVNLKNAAAADNRTHFVPSLFHFFSFLSLSPSLFCIHSFSWFLLLFFAFSVSLCHSFCLFFSFHSFQYWFFIHPSFYFDLIYLMTFFLMLLCM